MKIKKVVLVHFFLILIGNYYSQDASVIFTNNVKSTVTIETDIGLGSGFFVAENIIATNYHVIEGAKKASFYLNNAKIKYEIAGYVGVNKDADLILLQVVNYKGKPLKISTSNVKQGQKVYVLGSPKGLPATISDGIISGLRNINGKELIQITAPISPGSSGGPVLNSKGELIGVSVSQLAEGQNINFAVPKEYLQNLINNKLPMPQSIETLYPAQKKLEESKSDKYYYSITSISEYSYRHEKILSNYPVKNYLIVLDINGLNISIFENNKKILLLKITDIKMLTADNNEQVLKAFIDDKEYHYCMFYSDTKKITFVPFNLTNSSLIYNWDEVIIK